jgi:hypothetical protein
MSEKLPTIGELLENNPGLDVAGYGATLLLKAPPSKRFLAFEATSNRRNAQPHYKLGRMHSFMMLDLLNAADLLSHKSPKVQDRARAMLMEIASRAQALAEAGDHLESVIEATKDRARELMA